MFCKKKKSEKLMREENENIIRDEPSVAKSETKLIEKPKICLFDIDGDITARIKQKGHNVISASLGTSVNITYKDTNDVKICLPNHSIPPNLHEYDILVVDLEDKPGIPNDEQLNMDELMKGHETHYFRCRFPQAIFDPRPFGVTELRRHLDETKKSILIVFASEYYMTEYEGGKVTNSNFGITSVERYTNYSFLHNLPKKNRFGKEFLVLAERQELICLVKKMCG